MLCHVSVVLVLTIAMVLLAVIPAITIWSIVFVAMDESVEILDQASTDSLTNLSGVLQDQMIAKFSQALALRLQEAEHVAQAQSLLLQATGITSMDLNPSFTLLNEVTEALGMSLFTTVRKNPRINYMVVRGMQCRAFPVCNRTVWVVSNAMNFDLSTGAFNRTVYTSYSWAFPNYSAAVVDSFCPDQVTGLRKVQWAYYTYRVPVIRCFPISLWFTDVFFNTYTGQVELIYATKVLPAQNGTFVDLGLSLDVNTISAELQSELQDNPNDRLFIFFRQPHGHMLAASHGKYYSTSDVDTRFINPMVNPPNMTLIYAYTCLNSTDATIVEACQQLYSAANFSWTNIPEGRQELVIAGNAYWVDVGYTSGMNCTIVYINYKATIMGPIEIKKEEALDEAATWRMWTYVVLALAVFFAILAALFMGCWLRHKLRQMSNDMVLLGSLQFRRRRRSSKTVLAEMHTFQRAFAVMEQGLEAFARKIPGTARSLFRNKGNPDDVIGFHMVTVLYANVEGFAVACRNFPLSLVGTAISSCTSTITCIVIDRHGAIDKLIGDTVVATFNFPKEHGGHEGDAVESALAIQTAIYEQHSDWVSQGAPALRVRFGIQTGQCVIGDVDESHRLCAGDAMKEAGKLEALNKTVGTYCLVSVDIYAATKHHINYRQVFLGSDIYLTSPVYEPLCPVLPESPRTVLDNADDTFSQPLIDGSVETAPGSSFRLPPRLMAQDNEPLVAYHYCPVKESMLLAHCQRYEHAYDQYLASEYLEALQTLRQPVLDGVDTSWELLKKECNACHENEGHPSCDPMDSMHPMPYDTDNLRPVTPMDNIRTY